MKRSSALAPLSRDHQHALEAALRLRRADRESVNAAIGHFRAFFETEGGRHFEIEERCLVSALPADDPEWSAAVDRMLDDHHVIREAASELATGADRVALARSLGDRLHEHVRFEERVLFQLLERRLTVEELERLAVSTAEAERALGEPPR
jgi:hemerythrin-like domain-containing protein